LGGSGASDAGEIKYSMSAGLIDRLARLHAGLAFTSYQSGLLYMVGSSAEHGPQLHQSAVEKPMGLAPDPGGEGLTLASAASIIRFQNVLEPTEQANHVFDGCFVPRTVHATGNLDAHDVGRDRNGRIVFVNTRFNCLATVSDTHSFRPIWRPRFISALVDEDRCHLSGMAMEAGAPAYVTAISRSDTIDGWRDRRGDGGVVIDVRTDEIVCEGLSMPHSPRIHRGELWVLNSGTGELGVVSRQGRGAGRFEARAFCPGFVRGLSFHEGLAAVGLSKPRHERFEGLALDQRLRDADSAPWCGVQLIELNSGACVDWFRIDGTVAELFDVAFLPGHRCPMAVSPTSPDAVTLITIDKDRPSGRDAIWPRTVAQLRRVS
jgi:uncharacterized protein (TIGR03032 family)